MACRAIVKLGEIFAIIRSCSADQERLVRANERLASLSGWSVMVAAVSGVAALLTIAVLFYQLTQTERAFRVDARGWVNIGRIETENLTPPSTSEPRRYLFKLYLQNTGKTGAFDLSVRTVEHTMAGWNVPSFLRWALKGELEGAVKDKSGKPIGMADVNLLAPQYLGPGSASTTPIYLAGQEPIQPKPHSQTFLKVGSSSVSLELVSVIAGMVRYTDAFHAEHWVSFCFMVAKDGRLASCVTGNDADR